MLEFGDKMTQAQQVRMNAFYGARELLRQDTYGSSSGPSAEERFEATRQLEEFLWSADEERVLPRVMTAFRELLHQLSFSEYDTDALARAQQQAKIAMGIAETHLPAEKLGKKGRR